MVPFFTFGSRAVILAIVVSVLVASPPEAQASSCSEGIVLAGKVNSIIESFRISWGVDEDEISLAAIVKVIGENFALALRTKLEPRNNPTAEGTLKYLLDLMLDEHLKALAVAKLNENSTFLDAYPSGPLTIALDVMKEDVRKGLASPITQNGETTGATYGSLGVELLESDFFGTNIIGEAVDARLNPLMFAISANHELYLLPSRYQGKDNKHPQILGGEFSRTAEPNVKVLAAGLIDYDGRYIYGFDLPGAPGSGLNSGHFKPDRVYALHVCKALVKSYWKLLHPDLKKRLVSADTVEEIIQVITNLK